MSPSRINTDQLFADCQGDQQTANLRLESFCDWGMKMIDLIEISISDENWRDVNDLGCRMHGALESIAANPIANLAKTLVLQARQNACPIFGELRRETDSLVLEIEAYLQG